MGTLCLVDMTGKQQFELKQGKNYVGRDDDCEICVDSKLLSRKHAVIGLVQGQAAIRDLQSTNGTLVNFKPIHSDHSLSIGDAISFGEVTFRLAEVGVPIQQTMIGRIKDSGGSFSVTDPGGDATALRESMPLPHGWSAPSGAPSSGRIDVSQILERFSDSDNATVGVLVMQTPKTHDQQFIPLEQGVSHWNLGRGEPNQIILPDETISQNHARLSLNHQQWVVRDLGSKNGTKVNGRLIQQATLSGGEQIEFGQLNCVFVNLLRDLVPAG